MSMGQRGSVAGDETFQKFPTFYEIMMKNNS
jgi:hypothetical protein